MMPSLGRIGAADLPVSAMLAAMSRNTPQEADESLTGQIPASEKSRPRRAIHRALGGHVPVLLKRSVDALLPRPDGLYVDGTFGGGGHSRALLGASAPTGRVFGVDADPAAIARGEAIRVELDAARAGSGDRLRLVHGNFRHLDTLLTGIGVTAVDGVLLDLGLSSFQLDTADRGFAFRLDGPLDMRFDPGTGVSAADLVNTLTETELADIVYRLGEEHHSRRIASAIVGRRALDPIRSTADLAAVVERAVGGRRGETHPATRTFQALRIAVNGELDALPEGLAAAVALLPPGGRLAVISFHSLEDRIVKRFIADAAATCVCPPHQPICVCGTVPSLRKVGGSIKATPDETASNPRSRSAILRVAERLTVDGEIVPGRDRRQDRRDQSMTTTAKAGGKR